MSETCHCGRRMIRRRGDLQETCADCRSLPDFCDCESLADRDPFPAPTNPMGVARKILASRTHDDCLTLRFWRGGWMEWNSACWAEAERKAVESWAYERLEHAVYIHPVEGLQSWQPNRRKIADVIDALGAVTLLPEGTDSPAWLGTDAPFPASEAVVCANGLLHVRTKQLHPLTPRLFSQVAVPFPYDPAAPKPAAWLRFLHELWPGDPQSIAALQEFFGYVLSGRLDLHKILLLVGPTRSGKGTIARILTALIGKGNVANPTLASMSTNFGLSPLIGKPLAIVGDARLGRGDAHQVVERLLSISGEDMLTIDRKYREPWTGKLPTRFLIVSNELPRFGDASGAIAHRFVVLILKRSFLGQEDHTLIDKLMRELPGILRWSLNGFDRLGSNDRFTISGASEDAVVTLQDLVSPVAAFVRDRCQLSSEIAVDDIWAAWKEWAEDNGHRAGSKQSFGRDLRASVPSLSMYRPRDDGDRERRYLGISLRPAHNGELRGPSWTNAVTSENADPGPQGIADQDEPVRDGPRTNSMWAEQEWPTEPPDDPVNGTWPASETGPCTRCGTPCHRYGDGGQSLCETCRDGQPTPRLMPQRRDAPAGRQP